MREKMGGWGRMLMFHGRVAGKLFREYKGRAALLFLLSVLLSAEWIVSIRFSEYLTNEVSRLPGEGSGGLFAGAAAFLVLLLGFKATQWLFDRAYNAYSKEIAVRSDGAFLDKLRRIRYRYFEDMETYQDIHMAGRASGDYAQVLFLFSRLLNFGINLAAYTVIVGRYSPWYMAVLLVVYGASGAAANIASRKWDSFYERVVVPWQRREQYFEGILKSRVNHSNVQTNRQLPFFMGKYQECADQERRNTLKCNLLATGTNLFSGLVFSVVAVYIIIAVMGDVAEGRAELGAVTAVCAVLFNTYEIVRALVDFGFQSKEYMHTISAYERIMGFEEVPEGKESAEKAERENAEKESGAHMPGCLCGNGALTLEDLWYSYSPSKEVQTGRIRYTLKGVSAQFFLGEHIAVVGENGSGKTTLMQVLLGLLESQKGEVRSTAGKAAVIFQDFPEYAMTVRENIELGRGGEHMGDDEVAEILKKVGLWEAVRKLPQGMDTQIGQLSAEGVEFSKGQFQRLAVGRLLADDAADVWVLDEPTAYLDPIAEIEMYRNILELGRDKLIFFISHRLGFARLMDRILVIADGQIAEQGSHEELMRADGAYAAMYGMQKSWYEG